MRAFRRSIRSSSLFIRMTLATFVVAGFAPHALADIWEASVQLSCQAGSNYCEGSTANIPIGKVATIRHIACGFLVFVADESPSLSLSRVRAGSIKASEVFLPVLRGYTGASLHYIVNSPTLFYIQGRHRASVQITTKDVDKLALAACYLSGDISP